MTCGVPAKTDESIVSNTVIDMLKATASRRGKTVAYRWNQNGRLHEITWLNFYKDAKNFAKACIATEIDPQAGVAIQGANRYEWMVSNIGAIFAQAIAAGIYATNQADASKFVSKMCGAQLVSVESEEHLVKHLTNIGNEEPSTAVKCYVVWDKCERDWSSNANVVSWDTFMELGKKVDSKLLKNRIKTQDPDDCCTIIPTSGTTGRPKGVMLSHQNITWTAQVLSSLFKLDPEERGVSYLPLSHIAAQIVDCYAPMHVGATITIAPPDALKGTLVEVLKQVRPTMFLAVPRVWEKIREKMLEVGSNMGMLQRSMAQYAKKIGLSGAEAKEAGAKEPLLYHFVKEKIFQKVYDQLGLDQCKFFASGAAPLKSETASYFKSLGIYIHEIYGASETAGPISISLPECYRTGSVGKPLPGTKVIIAKDNEIGFNGPNRFMGYINNDEATKKTIDSSGLMWTGDLGKFDKDGFLFITGRKKEMLITAGAENVHPVPIEDCIREKLPIISSIMVIGDGRKFLSCLLTLRSVEDSEGNPTNTLQKDVIELFKALGSKAATLDEACDCPIVNRCIHKGIQEYNKTAESSPKKIRKFLLLRKDYFTEKDGLLTPTKKVKRVAVLKKYHSEIEKLYEEKIRASL